MAQLECLFDSPNKDSLAVIFIHGLNGDARGTWMLDEKDDSTLWPRWLASDVDCSVWLFGYDAKLSSWQDNAMPLPDQGDSVLETMATEEGLKNRPLLLIGHSMGGLVIKTLIHHGRTKGVPRYESVVKRIRGVTFVATPHNGSQLATLAKYAAVLLRTNPQVGNMQTHDAHLRSLNQQFLAYFNAKDTCVAVRTFAETKGVLIGKKIFGFNVGGTKLVVDPDSSEPHVPGEIAVRLPEDHSSICKLAKKGDQLYKSLLSFIKEDVFPKSQSTHQHEFETKVESTEPPPANKVQITKLPHTNSHLFGRETEIAMLDRAWVDGCNVLILKAMGGTGKTALLKHWLDQFVASNYRCAKAVFTWSFYSQGSAENKQTSTEDFFESAFRFFGYTDQNLPPPHERGTKLAQLVIAQRTLLILDGLEPLQHPVGIFHGELKDQGLKALLQQLAVKNPGLCLISSRQTVEELKGKPTNLVLSHDLEHLQDNDGVALLRAIGVKGTVVELTKAVKELAGHALALNLLGNYVKKVLGCDIRQRDKIPGLMAERNDGKHAEKMLAAYETHLRGATALSVLYLLGLFDRPVSPGAIQCLKQAKIPGLTNYLDSNADWCYALDDLREQRLLNAPNPEYADNLDCHPLIREYFGKQLQTQQPQAWQQAHKHLYEYYKALPAKELPDTLEEMQPLFSAVAHGCAAGLHQQVWGEVYWLRIHRQAEFYTNKKLGAFSDDLASIAHFFTTPWHTPAAGLHAMSQGALLNWAGFDLRALGRLREALEPARGAMEVAIKEDDWQGAAGDASNLSELQLMLGGITEALQSAQISVDYADQSANRLSKIYSLATYGECLHQAGQLRDSLRIFKEAVLIANERNIIYLNSSPASKTYAYIPEKKYLYGLRAFKWCNLLLELDEIEEVFDIYTYSCSASKGNSYEGLLHDAVDYFIACKLYWAGYVEFCEGEDESEITLINTTVDKFRHSGYSYYIPCGLFLRSTYHQKIGNFARARQDLQEVFDIAEGSGMRLHLTDYHLETARLLVAEEEAKLPENDEQDRKKLLQQHVIKAEKLINETGYHRRDKELAELQAQVNELLQKKLG